MFNIYKITLQVLFVQKVKLRIIVIGFPTVQNGAWSITRIFVDLVGGLPGIRGEEPTWISVNANFPGD